MSAHDDNSIALNTTEDFSKEVIATKRTGNDSKPAETTATRANEVSNMYTNRITSFVSNDDVTRAEVIWAMKCILSRFSMNASTDIKDVFLMMFSDSSIAKKLSMGSTKLSYYITFGLAPFFRDKLLHNLRSCSRIVVCFDEALNKIAQKGQMDIVIRFWDAQSKSVAVRYLNSAFMGHADAKSVLASFKEAMVGISLTKLLQVSMDGPAVNWKFLELLSKEEHMTLIEMGSCGLHVVHGAFQTGHSASGWNVNSYLRAMYGLFKDSPARRADYISIAGSTVFPTKFCQVRWIENVDVSQRALEVLPYVKKYVTDPSTKLPKTQTCESVRMLCSDKLAVAKISFFSSVGAVCETFLRRYQSSAPMAPFLYDDIGHLLRSLMNRFVKKAVLKEADTVFKLCKINVSSKESRCTYNEVDIGVAATKALNAGKLADNEKMAFRMQCLEFLCAMVSKIVERSPLKYEIVRSISCFVPSTIATSQVTAERRMKKLVEVLYEAGHISAITADKSKEQFTALCSKASNDLNAKFSGFVRAEHRLDKFYYDLIGNDVEFSELFAVLQIVLILSHGNASVESGFSINKQFLVENLHEESLVAQRIVHDHINAVGGLQSVNIDKSLLQFVKGSHHKYTQALEQKRKERSDAEKEIAAKKRIGSEVKKLIAKKAKLEESIAQEKNKIDMEIAELQKNFTAT